MIAGTGTNTTSAAATGSCGSASMSSNDIETRNGAHSVAAESQTNHPFLRRNCSSNDDHSDTDDCNSLSSELLGRAAASRDQREAEDDDVYNYDARSWKKVDDQTYRRKRKCIRRYYKQQNLLIDRLQSFYARVSTTEEPDADADDDEANDVDGTTDRFPVSLAIYGSFVLNVVLLAVKIVAAVLSGSMSVIASTADSALDLLSGIVLVVTQRLMNKSDPDWYPQGKSRMEPIGVFSFAIVMMLSSMQIVTEAVKRLVSRPGIDLGPYTIAILSFTIISKAVANRYCRLVSRKYKSSAADAYADDHRNDVMTNTVGVLSALVSVYVPQLWYSDSVGAICIAFYIIYCWLQTMREQLGFLTGRGAPPMLLQELTYIAANHDARIQYLDTVRAYHFGENYLVEVDIVLPEDMPLRESHDIGESLQHRLEQVENVERAFVHNDYEWEHSPVVFRGNYILRK